MISKSAEKPPKTRLMVRLDHRVARELKRERAETDTPVCRLIDEIVARYYDIELPDTSQST
jgi:hypothetical protein